MRPGLPPRRDRGKRGGGGPLQLLCLRREYYLIGDFPALGAPLQVFRKSEMKNNSDDMVITGLAAISAAGVGLQPLREALGEGRPCLRPVPAEILGEGGYLWAK